MFSKLITIFKQHTSRLPSITPRNIPTITKREPPSTGSGIVINTALNLPNKANMIYKIPVYTNTVLLAT